MARITIDAARNFFCLTLFVLFVAFPSYSNAAYDSAVAAAQKNLEIIKITPDGEDVPAGKQIVIQFNRPVVPLGRMERSASEIPVIISPALACEWRWINTSALACNLSDKDPLKLATKYSVEVKPGIKTEDGTTIAQAYNHAFITDRPDIRYKEFYQWKSPTLPILRLVFNQSVDKESVTKHTYLNVGEKQERVPLKVYPDPNDNEPPQFMPMPGEKYGLLFKKTPPKKSDEDVQKNNEREARRVWLVEPVQALSLDTHVVLKQEAGLMSAFGPEAGVAVSDVVEFDTYPQFAFLGVKCFDNDNNEISIAVGESGAGKCNPMRQVSLQFNVPVDRDKLSKAIKFTPPMGGWKQLSGEEEVADEAPEAAETTGQIGYQYRQPHEKGGVYQVNLPAGLKAAQEYTVYSRAKTMNIIDWAQYWIKSITGRADGVEVKDIFGRELKTSINGRFVTDHRNPNFVMDYSAAVLEKDVDSEVPFYVNNILDYTFNYRRVTTKKEDANLTFNKKTPNVKDIQFAVPFGVREMLGGKSGAIYGSLTTNPSTGNFKPPELFSQVTPYQVHFKLGHFVSLVWVTSMASGEPVAGAKVSLYQDAFTTLHLVKNANATAVTDASGIAMLPGTDTLDPDLSITEQWNNELNRFFLKVEKGEDMALLPVSYHFTINNYRSSGSEDIYPTNKKRFGHMRAWGTTAQGIYRAGDTMQYKIFLRNQDNNGLIPPPTKGYRLKIIDPMGKVVHDVKDVTLSPFGGYDGTFTVPTDGAVGWYRFKLVADYIKTDAQPAQESEQSTEESDDSAAENAWIPMKVLVSDFTPASFKVGGQLSGDLFHAGEDVEVTTRAELHSGGAYTDASARVTAILDSTQFTSKHPLAKDFQFDSFADETATQQLYQKIDKVGDKGELSLKFSTGAPKVVYGKLTVESAVADDRGKFISGQSRADYVGVDRLVGLKSTQWLYTVGKPASVQYIVVDDRGNPVKGTAVSIAIEHQVTKAARVKGAGNAYLTEYHHEWEQAGNCKGTSETDALTCTFTPSKAGTYRAVAKIKDTKGNDHSTTYNAYATGTDYVVWDDENDSALDVIPESTSYKVGDTARYLVKNPYPGAKTLVTIERFGVIDHFVKTLDGSTPVLEFKIKPEYLPGFYLSVVVVSPRVEKPLGEGQVDLGKPTFRMGYVSVPVNDPYKEMAITAKTDKDVYKPRDKVTVKLHAEPRVKDKKEPVELTVAVLDEAVFDLITGGKSNFDPYQGFYKLDKLDMRNYSLLMRLVGRQKFEKKGANPGGDGGADLSMRSLFKFVSYWNGSLVTDKDGNATASFEAPDNLTGWRVLAIASTPTDRFGLGDANFKVNRPTEVRPVMPNQLMEGDTFDAGFSVMNRTDKERTIKVNIHVDGAVNAEKTQSDLWKTITLKPYKRETVLMPIQTAMLPQTRDVPNAKLHFTVTAGDELDEDGVLHEVQVNKRRSLDVAANYGTTTQDDISEPILFPKETLPDTGSVSLVASPTVIGNIAGAFSYMRDYPYMCWEQQLSKAVMAAHFKNLKSYLPDTQKWDESEGLPQKTLDHAASFQAPNGGMSYFVASDAYADPYLSAYTALAFNWLRKSGYSIPEQVENNLQSYLSNLLKNDAVPDFYSEGMTSTIRAVALAALAERGKADLADLERYQPHVKKMALFGKSYFLQAALAIKGGEKYAPDVAKAILAMSNETGGKYVFSETWDDSYSRILASPLRENCAVLDAFTAFGEREEGKNLVGDVPFKLVRSITQSRKNRDHWENTQENMFCMNALIDFARVYEKDSPSFTVKASVDDQPIGTASFKDVRDPAVTMERPIKEGDAGQRKVLNITRDGVGRLYYEARLTYALPMELSKPANAGIEIRREYSVERDGKWQLLASPALIKRGELVRVDLYISVPAARNFVVVDDAVPGGLEPVNRELATTSMMDAKKGEFKAAGGSFWFKYDDWVDFGVSRWSFYHQEIRNNSVRFYSDYLDAGNYHLSYAAQAIATGTFSAMPSTASELYDTDVYGKTEGISLKVEEQAK